MPDSSILIDMLHHYRILVSYAACILGIAGLKSFPMLKALLFLKSGVLYHMEHVKSQIRLSLPVTFTGNMIANLSHLPVLFPELTFPIPKGVFLMRIAVLWIILQLH
ncbi:hypothetical protein VNO77_21113 [Canavalia gladiata]|uniref:Uncharacterized protein n=1 Tax=Canavalia gladiata TaxID=3824 RepID=A0AAN9LQV8_CANGL